MLRIESFDAGDRKILTNDGRPIVAAEGHNVAALSVFNDRIGEKLKTEVIGGQVGGDIPEPTSRFRIVDCQRNLGVAAFGISAELVPGDLMQEDPAVR